MAIKRILVPLEMRDTALDTLKVASVLAKIFEAHFDVFRASMSTSPKLHNQLLTTAVPGLQPIYYPLSDYSDSEIIEEYFKASKNIDEQQRKEFRDIFLNVCKEYDIDVISSEDPKTLPSASWTPRIRNDHVDSFAMHCRTADIIVTSHPGNSFDPWASTALNIALFEAHRPVFVVPHGYTGFEGKTVAISWNGSSEACQSVIAALPFLKKASNVIIITFKSDKTPSEVASDLQKWLYWHNIKAENCIIQKQDVTSVGAGLVAACEERDADLLVCGAFGHSRFREMVLGGVTRYLLERALMPLLLCH